MLDKHGEGVHHLGFQVADMKKTVQTLQRLGMSEEYRGRYDKENGVYVYGVTIALTGPTPLTPSTLSRYR